MRSRKEDKVKKTIILGISNFSSEVCYLAEESGAAVVDAFTVNRKYIVNDTFMGKPVVAYEDLADMYRKDEVEIIVTIGYSNMNENRKMVFEMLEADGWTIGSYVSPDAALHDVTLGKGNIIFDNVQIRHNAKLGDGNILLANTIISHNCSIGSFNYFAGSVHILGNNVIGDCNFFGNSSIKTDGGIVGNCNLFGAGTVVHDNCEDKYVVMPAGNRTIKSNIRIMNAMLMKNSK